MYDSQNTEISQAETTNSITYQMDLVSAKQMVKSKRKFCKQFLNVQDGVNFRLNVVGNLQTEKTKRYVTKLFLFRNKVAIKAFFLRTQPNLD